MKNSKKPPTYQFLKNLSLEIYHDVNKLIPMLTQKKKKNDENAERTLRIFDK
jgi:hypothetical protein